MNQIFAAINRLGRAFLDAHLAGDAPHLAHLPYLLAQILGAAGHIDPGLQAHQLDDTLGAGPDTGAATKELVRIDNRKAVHHGDGIEGTTLGALAQADARVVTGRWPPKAKIRGSARGKTDILVLVADPTLKA